MPSPSVRRTAAPSTMVLTAPFGHGADQHEQASAHFSHARGVVAGKLVWRIQCSLNDPHAVIIEGAMDSNLVSRIPPSPPFLPRWVIYEETE